MARINIRLFGKFSAQHGEQELNRLDIRKLQDLFCYLVLYRDRPHPRETLASILWGNTSTAQSKAYLRKALWQLQEALAISADPTERQVLLVDPDWVQLNAKADLWLDVQVFEQAFNSAQGSPSYQVTTACAQVLRNAVDIYRGDLLEGCYQDWCLYERERLQNMYLSILDKLMGYCETHQEYECGLTYGARILRYDRAREQTHRRLMRLHFLSGDRCAALRQYQRCVAALFEELNVSPTQYTTALYEQIRANQLDRLPSTPPPPCSSPNPGEASLAETLLNLKWLQAATIDMQRQIQSSIQALERVILARRE
jgi:DNA-binding SARP family transcriptional activator